jgi:hypothetical protein
MWEGNTCNNSKSVRFCRCGETGSFRLKTAPFPNTGIRETRGFLIWNSSYSSANLSGTSWFCKISRAFFLEKFF